VSRPDLQAEADEADAICNELNTLAMLFGNPERFHVTKDECAKRLRRLAKRLRGDAAAPTPTSTWRGPCAATPLQIKRRS